MKDSFILPTILNRKLHQTIINNKLNMLYSEKVLKSRPIENNGHAILLTIIVAVLY